MAYYVQGTDGKFYGPAELMTLNQWATEGRILADTVLVDQATNKQVAARDLPGLQHHFRLAGPRPSSAGPPQQQQSQQQPYQQPYQQPQQQPYQQPYRHGPQVNTSGMPSWMGYQAVNRNQPQYGPRKSKIAAVLLAFLLGSFGIHRFYLGYTTTAIAMLLITVLGFFLLCGFGASISWVWAIIDAVMILIDQMPDARGQPLD